MIPKYIKMYCQEGRGFFVDTRTGELYQLNRTGTRIMESLKSGMSRDKIPGVLVSEFDIGFDQASRDVDQFLCNLDNVEPLT